MYDYHRERLDEMYSDWVIYSHAVPVFRTDAGELLERPWTMSILTSPAVNGSALGDYAPDRWDEVPAIMTARTAKVLAVTVAHRVRRIILGAWGCGAFGLDPNMMSDIFRDALFGSCCGAFEEVVFAISDSSDDQRFISPFRRAFV